MGNNTSPSDHQKGQKEINAQADRIMVPLLLGIAGLALLIGTYLWMRKRIKKYQARKANANANDIELQQRAPREEPDPASPRPELFFLNQDLASGIDAPPPSYRSLSIKGSSR